MASSEASRESTFLSADVSESIKGPDNFTKFGDFTEDDYIPIVNIDDFADTGSQDFSASSTVNHSRVYCNL